MATYRDSTKQWRYRVTVRMSSGESVRISGTPALNSKAEAQAAERAHIQRTLHPVATATPQKPVTLFRDFVNKWWALYQVGGGTRGKNAHTTIKEKTSHLHHIVPALGPLPIEAVTNERLTEFAAQLRAKGLAEKTLKNIFTTLGTMLRAAVDWGTLARFPKLPRITPPTPEWDWLDERALASIQQLPASGDTAYTLALLCTGARTGEMLALEWSDINFQRNEIRLHRNRPSGSNRSTFLKGKKGRTVPMVPALGAALALLPRTDVRVFPLTPYLAVKAVERTLDAAHVERVTPHALRHGFASILTIKGVPLRKVQALCGHSSITTTQRYSHLAPGQNQDVVEALS